MNTSRSRIVIAALAFAAAALAGCGSSSPIHPGPAATPVNLAGTPAQRAALDKVVAASDTQVSKMKTMFATVYSDITFTAEYPQTLVITYTYLKRVDPAIVKPRLATQAPVFSAVCKTDFFRPMKVAGIAKPAAKLVWLNPDGSEVASFTCKS